MKQRHPIWFLLLFVGAFALCQALCGCSRAPRISGMVFRHGEPAANELIQAGEFYMPTNALGRYTFPVPLGWDGTVGIPRYGPLAAVQYLNVQEDHIDQNWIIEMNFVTISGRVTDATTQPAAPLAGVTMEVRGSTPDGQTWDEDSLTDPNGVYNARVPKGLVITVENYTPPVPVPEPPGGGAV